MVVEDRGTSSSSSSSGGSGPSIAVIAVIALLVVAGIAIWFTTQQPTRTSESTSTSTEYRENVVPSGGETNQGSGTQQETEQNQQMPDTSTVGP